VSLERAQLLKRYLNIDVPVASFDQHQADYVDPNETPDFNDIGDKRAAELGIGWTANGEIEYSKL
jgi:hypothetical protein